MKNLKLVLLGAVVLALISTSSYAATPTPVPLTGSPTQTPAIAATPAGAFAKNIGTSANWLSKAFAGTCLVNPASIAYGSSTIVSCTVPGVLTTDFAFVQAKMPNAADDTPYAGRDCWYVQSSIVSAADSIAVRIVNRGGADACDPPALILKYMILRPNTGY